jgi:hypothetical protein
MRRSLWTLAGLALLFVAGSNSSTSGRPEEPTDPRLEALRRQVTELQKQIEALKQREQELTKELQERAKEKDYSIKVEVKGRVRRFQRPAEWGSRDAWTITAQGLTWELILGKDEALQKLVQEHEGKTVIVTGKVVGATYGSRGELLLMPKMSFGPLFPVLVVTTLKSGD